MFPYFKGPLLAAIQRPEASGTVVAPGVGVAHGTVVAGGGAAAGGGGAAAGGGGANSWRWRMDGFFPVFFIFSGGIFRGSSC